ncbi:hypothetical protein H2200_003674 [Cladophialophora chaetospira]|uniref:Uncharacterized protein n=1 Tax=Cladophialophora chaetospira TaxID=386627 RepID=A0AA39CK73_9EURO|nr:hypothetical protein H2200_003674 [Cladophialophora chaetospira]
MVALPYFLFYAMLATLVACHPAAVSVTPGIERRSDISFACDCIDHWFKHGRIWIRASSTTGCMGLELVPKNIYALNALPKPDYVSNEIPNLICSLRQSKCQWSYSPLDFLSNSSSSDATTQQYQPPCENLGGLLDLLPPIPPFAEGPATPEESKLEASLSVKHARTVPEVPEAEAGKDDDSDSKAEKDDSSDSYDGEDSDSDEDDGDDQTGDVDDET